MPIYVAEGVTVERKMTLDMLAATLVRIEQEDTNYDKRYGLVLRALSLAHQAGLSAGFRIDPDDPEWPVAVIELPQGQVSWHMPQHSQPWDGHDTPEKYERCHAYTKWMLGK